MTGGLCERFGVRTGSLKRLSKRLHAGLRSAIGFERDAIDGGSAGLKRQVETWAYAIQLKDAELNACGSLVIHHAARVIIVRIDTYVCNADGVQATLGAQNSQQPF